MVRATPFETAIVHFLFLFHVIVITIVIVMRITKMTTPAMAPPTAAGTIPLLAALGTTSTPLFVVELGKPVVVVTSVSK